MRTTRADSRRITSTSRGSFLSVVPTSSANAEGWTSASRTIRPSALETTFWLTTRTSPVSSGVPWAAAAANSSAATSSPARTSGRPRTPSTSSRGTRAAVP